jgi:pimeloyl-ACP methyl ester carboxylesterase
VKGGIVAAATAAAAATVGAAVIADRRIRSQRGPAMRESSRFTPPEPTRAGYVRADDGVRLYFEEDGPADAPLTVVLLHGFCQNHDDLLFQRRALLARLGDSIRILAFDLRSHGRSSRSTEENATIDNLGADLRAVLDARAPTGRLVLIGHSMGGMTVLALADAHPELFAERVDGVALISTSTGRLAYLSLGIPAGLARIGDPAIRIALRGVRRQSKLIERGRARVTDAAWLFTKRLAFGPHADPALVEFMTQMIGDTPVDVIADFFPTLTSHDKLAALDVLVDLPVVIICGEDDLITPPEHSRAMADLLPKATLVLVPETGHQVLMERPELVSAPLLRLVEDAVERG